MNELNGFCTKMLGSNAIDFDQEVAVIVNKIESGRYRSPLLFINDVKYIIEGKIMKKLVTNASGKEQKESIASAVKGMIEFLKEILEPKLEI